jgi:hypothetical protein
MGNLPILEVTSGENEDVNGGDLKLDPHETSMKFDSIDLPFEFHPPFLDINGSHYSY